MLQSSIRSLADSVVSLGRGARRGSGLVVGPGRVAVLRHPLRGDRVEVVFQDGRSADGELAGIDRRAGVALLRAETGDAPAVTFAAELPDLGDAVFALGDPGSGLRVTSGAVSSPRVSIRSRGGRLLTLIEHTAPIPRGAGGGALADAAGAVIGVNALRGDPGFALAIPGAEVQAAIARIDAGRDSVRLGVALASAASARRLRAAVGLSEQPGLLVRAVEQASPAERAGVKAGDLIVGLGASDVAEFDELLSAIDAAAGGERVALRVVRGAERAELEVDLTGSAS
jgi:S1-C subfamily serine protease